ncbi:hypothetical protein ACFL0D_07535 [Thermoproteota archaeon]
MYHPSDRTVNELLEDRRKEISWLMIGALCHIGINKHDISARAFYCLEPEVEDGSTGWNYSTS